MGTTKDDLERRFPDLKLPFDGSGRRLEAERALRREMITDDLTPFEVLEVHRRNGVGPLRLVAAMAVASLLIGAIAVALYLGAGGD